MNTHDLSENIQRVLSPSRSMKAENFCNYIISKKSIRKRLVWIATIAIIVLFLLSGCKQGEYTEPDSDGEVQSEFTLQQLNSRGKKIGVATGSKADNVVREQFLNADVLQFATVGEGFIALKTGKLDAFCYDRGVLQYTVAENPDLTLIDELVALNDLAIGVSPRIPGLLDEVNAVIKRFMDDGTTDDMKKRWLESGLNPVMPDIPVASNPTRKLVIGTSYENPPMNYLDGNGNPSGLDVEYAKRLAAELNAEIEIVSMEWVALIPSLHSGKIDLIVANLNITEERKQSLPLSDPYVFTDIAMMVRRQAIAAQPTPKEYRAEDFAGKKIGIVTGSTYDRLIDVIPNAERYYFQSFADAAEAVDIGIVYAALYSEPAARRMASSRPELTPLYPAVTEESYGAVFNRENDELMEKFNIFLSELKAGSVYDDMIRRWIDSPDPPPMPDMETTGANGTLIFATAAEDEPFSYIKNGALAGFDVELAYRFADYMDMNLEISLMGFDAMFPALQSGRADFACNMVTITEERTRAFGFSDPYYTGGAVMIVRAGLASAETQSFWESVKHSFYQNLIVENRWKLVTDGLRVTMIISIFAMLLGTLLGFLICFMMLSKLKILGAVAKIYTMLLRGTPIVVLLMIIFYVIFAKVNISPVLVAIVAFGLNAGAFVGGLTRTAILTVDKGQIEAARSMGFGSIGAFFLVTLPQASKVALPIYKSEFVSLVKATAVVGYIAIMDLTKAGDIIRSRTYDAFFPLLAVALVYFIITGAFILLFGCIEKRTDKRRRRKKV